METKAMDPPKKNKTPECKTRKTPKRSTKIKERERKKRGEDPVKDRKKKAPIPSKTKEATRGRDPAQREGNPEGKPEK